MSDRRVDGLDVPAAHEGIGARGRMLQETTIRTLFGVFLSAHLQ
jgi:hypothetical protein